MASNLEVEPGAASESVLLATESLDHRSAQDDFDFTNMTSSLEEIKGSNAVSDNEEPLENSNVETLEESADNGGKDSEEEDFTQNNDWTSKDKHIFVLSSAGKPIYTRYGNEDKQASLFGVMQTLVSFVQSNDDSIQSIHAGDKNFVFLVKKHVILVAVSQTQESTTQLVSQLNYVYNQIISVLTLSKMNKIFEQRPNYDLRRQLTGVERLIDHLLNFSEKDPAFTLGAVQCLPMAASTRDAISSAIVGACSKIKNLVFAIVLADNKLITLVRMKKYCLHPADLHLIFNLVQSSESLKIAESWTPLCLPRFDASGYMFAHISYLAEDCQACLFLLTVESQAFFDLSEIRKRIVEKLRRNNCLEAINESLSTAPESCVSAGFPELRHYLYKCKSTAQFYQPSVAPPYNIFPERLNDVYKKAHQLLHSIERPLKLIFEKSSNEVMLAWDTRGFELYVVFEPIIDYSNAINTVSRLLSWIKKKEEKLFHLNAPTF